MAAGLPITLWVKVGIENQVNRMFVYYTTDGSTFPEGAGGEGRGQTQVAEAFFDHDDTGDGTIDWWRGEIPAQTGGTLLRYKVGTFKQQNGGAVPFAVPFPNDDYNLANKKSMMGVWEIDGFDAGAATFAPHNDFSISQTGLDEGFHVLSARAFLERDDRASIYNTFVQPFYYDAMEVALRAGDWAECERYADALEAYTAPEPLPQSPSRAGRRSRKPP